MENWLPISGYESIYMVSFLGEIKSLERTFYSGKKYTNKKTNPEKILTHTVGVDGYCRVTLKAKPLKARTFLVHRIVATAFIENKANLPEVNHLNGNKQDNRAINLEWVTPKQNSEHSWKTGLSRGNTGRKGSDHPRSKRVLQIDNGIVVNEFGSLREIERKTDFRHVNVCKAIKNMKPYRGFDWKYSICVIRK